MASLVDFDRVRRNDDRLTTLQLILSGPVDVEALKGVLRMNTKVAEVIIYVDETFLVQLPEEETQDLFRTIGGMPNLQKLGFHSQSGSSGVLSVHALVAITSQAARLVHFGLSDVCLWGTQDSFEQWATQLQTQLFLQSFCVCECELMEPSNECPLDPVLVSLSILPSLEALFFQAATANALGRVSFRAVSAICAAPQLQDLRIGNFELGNRHIDQLSQVLPSNGVLSELKLDAGIEFLLETAHALAKILKYNNRLKSLELGLTSMISDECAVTVAESLRDNNALESFTLSRGANARFRPFISKVCQDAFVEMLQHNFTLETLVLFQRFPVKEEFKLYLTLNKYGRKEFLRSHTMDRGDWIRTIYKVGDDLDSIFYYLSMNPGLCRHCSPVGHNIENKADQKDQVMLFSRNAAAVPRCNNVVLSSSLVNLPFSGYKRSRSDRNQDLLDYIRYSARARTTPSFTARSLPSSYIQACYEGMHLQLPYSCQPLHDFMGGVSHQQVLCMFQDQMPVSAVNRCQVAAVAAALPLPSQGYSLLQQQVSHFQQYLLYHGRAAVVSGPALAPGDYVQLSRNTAPAPAEHISMPPHNHNPTDPFMQARRREGGL